MVRLRRNNPRSRMRVDSPRPVGGAKRKEGPSAGAGPRAAKRLRGQISGAASSSAVDPATSLIAASSFSARGTSNDQKRASSRSKAELLVLVAEMGKIIEKKDEIIEKKDEIIEKKDEIIEKKDEIIYEKEEASWTKDAFSLYEKANERAFREYFGASTSTRSQGSAMEHMESVTVHKKFGFTAVSDGFKLSMPVARTFWSRLEAFWKQLDAIKKKTGEKKVVSAKESMVLEEDTRVNAIVDSLVGNAKLRKSLKDLKSQIDSGLYPKELEHVHPVARVILRTIHQNLKIPDLSLYLENEVNCANFQPVVSSDPNGIAAIGATRKPDGLFYVHKFSNPKEAPGDLNACTQRSGVLGLEWKRELGPAGKKSAIAGLVRDFGHTLMNGANREMHYFYGLCGDGLNWFASKWWLDVSRGGKNYSSRMSMSSDFSFPVNLDRGEVREFVRKVVFLVRCATSDSPDETYNIASKLDLHPDRFQLTRLIARKDSFHIFQVKIGEEEKVIKWPENDDESKDRFKAEKEKREKLFCDLRGTFPNHFAECESYQLNGCNALVMSTIGTSLDRLCYCSKEKRENYARIVLRDIRPALEWLHKKNYAFVDLHPGNILIVTNADHSERACLVDFESSFYLKSKGKMRPETYVRIAFNILNGKNPTPETDMLCLMLVLDWILKDRNHDYQSGHVERALQEENVKLIAQYQSLDNYILQHPFLATRVRTQRRRL